MARQNYVGYHTCKIRGGYDHIRNEIPFLSGDGENQWLTQGYYFWTDSPYWAKTWGTPNQRVIGKFDIHLCNESELLDLVGNVEHSIEFESLIDIVMERLDIKQRQSITVNRAIEFLRKLESQEAFKGLFPYLAVKAQDKRYVGSINFIHPKPGSRAPQLLLKTRQQMCVFKEAKDRIGLRGFVEPNSFVDRFSEEQNSGATLC